MSKWEQLKEWLGWHKPADTAGITYDEVNTYSWCKYCNRKIMQDSQGGWFV